MKRTTLLFVLLSVSICAISAQTDAVVTATKTALFTTDNGLTGSADPGDIIKYTVVLENHGPGSAIDITYFDLYEDNRTPFIDPNMSLVVGSTTMEPMLEGAAIAKGNYEGDTDLRINVANAMPEGSTITIEFSVLVNDRPWKEPIFADQLCNQGFSDFVDQENAFVITDDPAVDGSTNPTCVPMSACSPPGNIAAQVSIWNKLMVSWEPEPNAETYRIRARYTGTKKWQTRVLRFGHRATIGARAGSTVEFQVQTICEGDITSVYSNTMDATIPGNKSIVPGHDIHDLIISENSPNSLAVYPNLVSSYFNVEKSWQERSTVTLLNMMGKMLRQVDLPSGQMTHTVLVDDLPPGVYLVKLHGNGVTYGQTQIIKF